MTELPQNWNAEYAQIDAERKTRVRSGVLHCPRDIGEGEVCGAEIQLTRKTYWSVDEDELHQVQTDQPDMWTAYCEVDHNLIGDGNDGFEATEVEVVSMLKAWFAEGTFNKSG